MNQTLLAPPQAPPVDTASTSTSIADDSDHRLVRPALISLLLGTALLYLWGLSSSGWANSFYSAAVQAGSESWKAFFFGSSDAANSITVDKTPMSLWPMIASVRIFGLSSWSILVPQALMGVASVGLLYATVRRTTGNAWAGLTAGAILALTPVAVLMFRFNNPDALLTLLLIAAVYATLRAIESPERAVRWLVLGGTLVGFAFLTKMMQAFLVLPPLAIVYLLAARPTLGVRLRHLLIAFGSMIAAAGWWIAIVELWPASSRPYIGGSQNNSILELTLGYNGFGRLNGNETGSVGGGTAGGGSNWGETGLLRMFSTEIGGQIAWLLPASIALLGLGLWFRRSAGRSDRLLSGLVVWGAWLIVTVLTFSLMAGIFHAYYTVALAPAIAALVAIGGTILWQNRHSMAAALGAAFVLAMTASLSFVLLQRSAGFVPWLKYAIVIVGVAAALLIVVHRFLPRRVVMAVAAATLITMLAGPAAYAVDTAATAHTGSIPTAGPSTGTSQGGPGAQGGAQGGGQGGGHGTTQGQGTGTTTGTAPAGTAQQGNAGGLLSGSESTAAITSMLTADADSFTWAAAAVGANSAAGYQLAAEVPVMPIGGFNGSDPSPTLAQFKAYVAAGEIHYFIGGGEGGGGGGRGGGATASGSTSTEITSWVTANFSSENVDGVTVFDLSGGIK